MSYLNTPRLTFSGQFQADPSTVNNDPTHFNNVTFNSEYQNYSDAVLLNGWWNPDGTGNWRLIGCTIKSVTYMDGTTVTDPMQDPIIGASVMDTDKRTAAKLVDLDSQQQMVSEIWGMVVRIVAGDGTVLLKGDYETAPFTNIWFNRSVDLTADAGAGAIYQSVIQNLQWNINSFNSRYLKELNSVSATQLSINFNVDRYNGDNMSPQFTLGRLAGAIGPSFANEPDHFVMGRQFAPPSTPNPLNFGAGIIDSSSNTFVLDFGNSLQFSTGGVVNETRDLRLAYVTGLPNSPVYNEIGKINYNVPNWYMGQSGLCVFPLTADQKSSIQNYPLAIIQAVTTNVNIFSLGVGTTFSPLMSEAPQYVRADKFVFRLNPTLKASENTFTINFYATNLGAPADNVQISLTQSSCFNQNGNGSTIPLPAQIKNSASDPNYAKFSSVLPPYYPPSGPNPNSNSFPPYTGGPQPNTPPQPVNGIPTSALSVSSNSDIPTLTSQTDNNGFVSISVSFADPGSARELQYYLLNEDGTDYTLTSFSPQQFMDGQYYNINYNYGTGSSSVANPNPGSNFISILIFNGPPQIAPKGIAWETLQVILQQYANLYPLMSKGIFNIADQKTVDSNAQILLTAFSKDINDPNYMPATRDLSAYKLWMIQEYLQAVISLQGQP